MILTPNGPFDMVKHWVNGFWALLKFGMQMCIILVTGHALASSKPVRRLIDKVAALPKGTASGAALVCFAAALMALINWGLGLIVGALLAREVGRCGARRGISMHYPLLGAAGYVGLMVWHGGLSGSAPITASSTDPGTNIMFDIMGALPVSSTVFSPMNIFLSIAFLAILPALVALMTPKDAAGTEGFDKWAQDAGSVDEEPRASDTRGGVAGWLENSLLLSVLIGVMGMSYVVYDFATGGFARLGIDSLNFFFLFVGILLHGTPIRYVRAVGEGVKSCAGIILQFPFYSGIMGMIKFSGLVGIFSAWVVSISGPHSFVVFTFFGAGIVNIFVPSGGGQWAVQGPVVVKAAQELGVSFPRALMAVAYGDEWTNMFQPFWALPLLGITGLKARDIIGYSMMILLLAAPLFILALLFLPA